MEGPYRDLGSGFARLTGVEGVRRGPSRLTTVEDALFELLRNARDAGARNVYVASSLHKRRYRTLTVIDDGDGIPEPYRDLVFEPGVTTRHLEPGAEPSDPTAAPHGAGMSLYHIRNVALEASVVSASNPTSVQATFDTQILPERSLQSGSRPSRSNLAATLRTFLQRSTRAGQLVAGYYASPARILATLIHSRIIQTGVEQDPSAVVMESRRLGLGVSEKTIRRIMRREIPPALGTDVEVGEKRLQEGSGRRSSGARMKLEREELAGIEAILRAAAHASYLDIGDLDVDSRPGEVVMRARIYEPEDEYE